MLNDKNIDTWVKKSLQKKGTFMYRDGYAADGYVMVRGLEVIKAIKKWNKGWNGEAFQWRFNEFTKAVPDLSKIATNETMNSNNVLQNTGIMKNIGNITVTLGICNDAVSVVNSDYLLLFDEYTRISSNTRNSPWIIYNDKLPDVFGLIMPMRIELSDIQNQLSLLLKAIKGV